jgi:large subunit ribosomal protein L30
MVGEKRLRITLVKSIASTKQDHRATARGLGLKWTNHTVEVIDTPSTRGMVNKIGYLLKVSEPGASERK